MSGSGDSRLAEVVRFAAAGVLSFALELGTLILLRDGCGLDTLAATPLAFLLGVTLNYVLCVRWVFTGTKEQRNSAKAAFAITSLIGLGLNELLMLLFRHIFGEDGVVLTVFSFTVTMYMVNKILATMIVMVWNYFSKRAILKRG